MLMLMLLDAVAAGWLAGWRVKHMFDFCIIIIIIIEPSSRGLRAHVHVLVRDRAYNNNNNINNNSNITRKQRKRAFNVLAQAQARLRGAPCVLRPLRPAVRCVRIATGARRWCARCTAMFAC